MLTRTVRALLLALLTLLIFGGAGHHAAASVYGRGGYGTCGYMTDCASTNPGSGGDTTGPGGSDTTEPPAPVEVTLPSGLEVSINLSDGQVIPRSGYTVTMTPLNGVGKSFDHAEIYIDGQLITTVKPDDTGTAHWDWDPVQIPGTTVKITLFDADGASVSHTFHVVIGSGSESGGGNASGNPQSGGDAGSTATNPVQRFVEHAYHGAETFIKKLPRPVVYSFPYILFILLGVVIFILLLQVKRELSEYEALLLRLDREKVARESKRTLMELVAHYLRTPLTVMRGGIDMLEENPNTTASATTLAATAKHLQENIEAVIAEMHAVDGQPVTSADTSSPHAGVAWRQPGLYLPLVLIAAVVFSFDYLAEQADRLSASQVIFTTHIIIYSILAVVMYQVLRRLQLRRRDTAALQQLITAEQTTNQARDLIVDKTLVLLQDDISRLDTAVTSLPASAASKFVQDGQARFHDLLTNVTVATALRGSHDTEPYTFTASTSLLDTALKDLRPKADAKHITLDVRSSDNSTHAVQSPELLAFVLHTSLDNAIAYSPEQSTINVTAAAPESDIIITITDHGLGITADKQAYLFQPFSKAEGAETFTHEGMGFSLYLSRLIMTYVGGSIELTSAPNQGTAVTITIPTQQSDSPQGATQ